MFPHHFGIVVRFWALEALMQGLFAAETVPAAK
jgi:hypothetical protein